MLIFSPDNSTNIRHLFQYDYDISSSLLILLHFTAFYHTPLHFIMISFHLSTFFVVSFLCHASLYSLALAATCCHSQLHDAQWNSKFTVFQRGGGPFAFDSWENKPPRNKKLIQCVALLIFCENRGLACTLENSYLRYSNTYGPFLICRRGSHS